MKQNPPKSLRQFVRYILVGGFNTLSSFCIFAILNWSFRGLGPYSYLYAAALANFTAISVSFLGYKWFVFHTRGNYLREWIRCFGVYGGSALIGMAGLPILVPILRRTLHRPELASYLAAGIMTTVGMASSFLGHKHFSFRQRTAEENVKGSSGTPTA